METKSIGGVSEYKPDGVTNLDTGRSLQLAMNTCCQAEGAEYGLHRYLLYQSFHRLSVKGCILLKSPINAVKLLIELTFFCLWLKPSSQLEYW